MKPPLTEQQKQDKKQRASYWLDYNRIKSAFAFKKIKSFYDLQIALGYTDEEIRKKYHTQSELDRLITFSELKDILEDYRLSLECEIYLRNNPPQPDPEYVNNGSTPTIELAKRDNDITSVSLVQQGDTLSPPAEHDEDYGLPFSKRESAQLFWFQKKAAKEILDGIIGINIAGLAISKLSELCHNKEIVKTQNQKRGQILLATTGAGKTFIAGAVLCRLLEMRFQDSRSYSAWPYLYVTKATVVEQTKRVFEYYFGIDTVNEVNVINIEQLRSQVGEMYVRDSTVVQQGEAHVVWEWRNKINPIFIFWDECQILKNETSQQSKIAQAYNDLDSAETYQVFISATPYTRVCEAKCATVAMRLRHNVGTGTHLITNSTWSSFASNVADPADPYEYCEAAVDRLTKIIDPYIVRVIRVIPQFKALNSVKMINFENEKDRQYYLTAFERYLAEKAKLEKEGLGNTSHMMVLVEFLKFRQAAELCRAHIIAKAMYESVYKHGNAAVCALNFKATLIRIVKILNDEFKVPRDKISLVWGGGNSALTKKQKAKKKITENTELFNALTDAGITLEGLNLDKVEDKIQEELPPELRLGPQNKNERQAEIDKFQAGTSLFCIYTFRAGGVGLSLHHTDERTPFKCKRKKNGYVNVEDIPKVFTKPRINFVAPTFSAIELVQGLGRCPRLTSLSETIQILLFFAGTIEEHVAAVVSKKLRCLSRVVRIREDWSDVIVGGDASSAARKHIAMVSEDSNDGDDGFITDSESGSDDKE